jgi:hypothetical protein
MTYLCPGLRARPNLVATTVKIDDDTTVTYPAGAIAVCDYPTEDTFQLKLVDTRTGHTIKEITKDRVGLPPHSNGNGCWNPTGTHIIFQVQAGTNIHYGPRDPGWGTGCNFAVYELATDTITMLTNDDFPGDAELQWARFQPIWYSATGIIYTYRYAEQTGTEGSGRWQLRASTISLAGTPEITADVVYLDPQSLGWGYLIIPFALFPSGHPFQNRFLVAGTLDSLTHLPRHMKHYAVAAPSTKTKFAAIVDEESWNEGANLAPNGEMYFAPNGTGLLPATSGITDELTTREYGKYSADGSTYTELTGFNVAGMPEYVGDVYGMANMQHGAFSADGRTIYAGMIVKNLAGTVVAYNVVKVDLA